MGNDVMPGPEDLAANGQPAVAATLQAPANGCPDVSPSSCEVVTVGLPHRIGEYEVLGELGRGGMGVVYKAFDLELKRLVAIKMLWPGKDASTDELVRFRGEAELVAALQHPNIVHIYDIGQHNGRPFLALEYVDGGGLDKHTQGQPQPPKKAAETIATLARAMHALHLQGIIHRDLKPANVLMTKSGILKITDFGLAKRLDESLGFSNTGDVMGTPCYMAPEQASGQVKDLGPAVDVYALGAMFYELLTGRPPFRGVTALETMEQVRSAEPAPPSRLVPKLHRDLSTICLKCLHKAPDRRYHSAEELADDLHRWLDGNAIKAKPVGPAERLWHLVRRRPREAALAVTSGLMVAALVLLGMALRQQGHAKEVRRLEAAHYEAELLHQAAAQKQQEEFQEELQQKHDLSLKALNDIFDELVREGSPLSQQRNLDAMRQRLLDYYEQLVEQESGGKQSGKEQLAGALARQGLLLGRTGDKAVALKYCAKAQELYENLGPAHRADLARVLREKGDLLRRQAHLPEAEAAFLAARALLEELGAEAGDAPQHRQELAEVHHKLGEVYANRAERDKALASFKQARDLRQKLLDADPGNALYRRNLARSHGYLGDVEMDLNHMDQADASYTASQEHRQALAPEGTADHEARFQLARGWANFGSYQTRVGALDTAAYFYKKALATREDLVQKMPDHTEYQTDYGDVNLRLADLKMLKLAKGDTGTRPGDVAEPLRKSLAAFEAVEKKDAEDASARAGLAEGLVLAARLQLWEGKPAAVEASLERANKHLAWLRGRRNNPEYDYLRALAEAMTAEVRAGQKVPEAEVAPLRQGAARKFREAVEKGFRGLHVRDLRQERGFQSVRDLPEFQEALCRCAEHGAAKAP